jgi:gamma-glutamylcyclotransferase
LPIHSPTQITYPRFHFYSPHNLTPPTDPPTKSHDMLVYIDRQRTTPDVPRKEYIYRMNQGISDAIKLGMPQDYVDGAIRRFIPQQNGDEEIGEFARGQAARFRDESGVFR